MTREALLARTLVELADNLVDDFDIVDLLTTLSDRCVEVLDIAAAGIMLVAPDGELRVMTSSSEAMRVVELFELQSQEGPCLDCYRSGEAVVNQDLAAADGRWPALRRGRPRSRVPIRRRRPDAPPRPDHRRPQPVPQRTRCAQRRRRHRRPSPRRRRHHRPPAAPHRRRRRGRQRAAHRRPQQPHPHRTGQGHHRRTTSPRHGASLRRLRTHARNNNLRLGDLAHEVVYGTLDLA